MTHVWRIRRTLWQDWSARYGQPCRVIARGRKNSVLVEFEDGFRLLTLRHFIRKLKTPL